MNQKPSSSKSANSTTSNDMKRNNIVISKLRRLKIEENLLLQSLQKLDGKRYYEVTESDVSNNPDYKNMLKSLKDSYLKIKNLFDDVKTMTCSQELLAEIEIEDIKNKVLELETTLKSFKVYLNTELTLLKTAEQELTKQMEEVHFKETNMGRKRGKTPSTNYHQVVPSPVRLLMSSPFKCTEVQEFQDFMKNSPNRYGGWNEYHHNLFTKYWQKYFGNTADTDFNKSCGGNYAFENFFEEALSKLQGISKECLILHIEWYKKYLILKDQQQKAIDKWKAYRRSIRRVSGQVLMKNLDQDSTMNDLTSSTDAILDFDQISSKKSQSFEMKNKPMRRKKINQKIIEQDDIERLMRPTKQWLNRNYEVKQKEQDIFFIENTQKLRTPNWRQFLA